MYGAIIGDIIGSRFEFDRGPWTKEFELLTDQDNWTDDSVMTIAIMEALMNAGKEAPVEEIRKECVKSMQKWGRKYPNAGYGSRFIFWVHSKNPEPYNSWGNGSAMRVSGAGWIYDTLSRTREVARATAEVSHNHPEGIKGAECTAAVMFLARTGVSKENIKEYVIKEFGYNVSKTVDELRPLHHHEESCMDALPKALISFFEGDSYEDVVRNAVSLGGDTDTIAAIAGAMADAMYGIPVGIIVKGLPYLEEDMADLCKAFQDFVKDETTPDPYKDNRYIKMAAEDFASDRSEEKLFRLFNVLTGRMLEDGEIPMAMVDVNNAMESIDFDNLAAGDTFSLDRDMRLRIDTVTNGNGKEWIPLYTDEEELTKQPTTNIQVNMPIYDVLASGLHSDRAEGVVINPFGLGLLIPKDILQIVIKRVDELKGEKSDGGKKMFNRLELCFRASRLIDSVDIVIWVEEGALHYSKKMMGDSLMEKMRSTDFIGLDDYYVEDRISEVSEDVFGKKIDSLNIAGWKKHYKETGPYITDDGYDWSLIYETADGKTIKTSGANAYPKEWNRLIRYIRSVVGNTGIVKLRKNDSTMHSGFEAPAIGTVLSKNTTIKKTPDGTLSVTEGE